jgi:hypothetical protein
MTATIGTLIGIAVILFAGLLIYCCLVVASRADRWR